MKKNLVIIALCTAATGLFADANLTSEEQEAARKKQAEEYAASIYRHSGGRIKKPGEQKGRIVYVNCQKTLPVDVLKQHCAYVDKSVQIAAEVVEGTFDIGNPAVKGEATIFIIDDPALPMSLVAPESMWCAVNVDKIKSEKPQFMKARALKELSRTLCHLAGGVGSQFPLAITRPVKTAQDLDEFPDMQMPFDVIQRFRVYLPSFGITPYKLVTYRKACKAGWAPNPTNDVQKKIWDDVHTLPTDPIKIKYDPKRDK